MAVLKKSCLEQQDPTLTFAATCPVGQVRFNFHLPYSNFHLPLKKCMFYNVSFKNKEIMVLACENTFSRISLDARPQNLHTFSKVSPKYTAAYLPSGASKIQFLLALQL